MSCTPRAFASSEATSSPPLPICRAIVMTVRAMLRSLCGLESAYCCRLPVRTQVLGLKGPGAGTGDTDFYDGAGEVNRRQGRRGRQPYIEVDQFVGTSAALPAP